MFLLRNIHYAVWASPMLSKSHQHCHFGHCNQVMPMPGFINQSEICIEGTALCEVRRAVEAEHGRLTPVLSSVGATRSLPGEGRSLSYFRVHKN